MAHNFDCGTHQIKMDQLFLGRHTVISLYFVDLNNNFPNNMKNVHLRKGSNIPLLCVQRCSST